jgi:uncharacterized protein YndB with AHSA1/START domain
MSKRTTEERAQALLQEYDLDAAPEKVWRAISIPALRERWLPARSLADVAPDATVPGEEISFKMTDVEPPHLESVVTFQLRPNERGGTTLRILHRPADTRLATQQAANTNGWCKMQAA